MSPQYLEELANIVDPDEYWALSLEVQRNLPPEKKAKLDAGVALRRYANLERSIRELIPTERSLLITPFTEVTVAYDFMNTPPDILMRKKDHNYRLKRKPFAQSEPDSPLG